MLDDRKLDVLKAIVTDYVSSKEPVGSKALVERHGLRVSPATVRNDMAVLEEEGYVTHPHTSAGRIPTDKGYRLFVDRIATLKPLSGPERRAIQAFMTGAVDLDDIVRRTVRLLAQITHQVAIMQYPVATTATIRHLELVSLSTDRILIVLIMSSGSVEQRIVELPGHDEQHLVALSPPPSSRPSWRSSPSTHPPAWWLPGFPISPHSVHSGRRRCVRFWRLSRSRSS